jgi:hypothetical protein
MIEPVRRVLVMIWLAVIASVWKVFFPEFVVGRSGSGKRLRWEEVDVF